jgi:putative endopeptidase
MRTLSLIVLATAACSGSATPPPAPPALPMPAPEPVAPAPAPTPIEQAPAPMTLEQSGIVPGWLDKSADPCIDFFQYACGGFVRTAEIPPDRASWGAIEMVTRENEEFLKSILEAAAAHPSSDPTTKKLGDYYAACMDEPAIDKAGAAPIQRDLDTIAKVTDAATAARAVIELHTEGYSPFFDVGPTQDFVDATQVIAGFDQAGLGLPDRGYYLDNKDTQPKIRNVYREHQVRMFQLLGLDAKAAKAAADNAWRVEYAIATAQQDKVTRREPHNVYHRVELAGLSKVAPSFPWADLLAALGIGPSITVNEPAYFTRVAKLIATEKPAVLRDYLTWTVLRESASDLSKPWVDEAFTMEKELAGVKELPPRWRRCVHHVDDELGELLGQSYVKAKFAGSSKTRAVELTKSVLDAMRVELEHLPWMDDTTRGPARQKLEKMAYLVGYPDVWRNYDFDVSRTDFAANVRAATKWELARQLHKIGRPVDRFDWQMTPPTVNAYYDPSLNELALPAGQLQPPFFGERFHPAVNFGSTGGGTIGHEMTHGFDDEGSQFDASGNLHDWWTAATKAKFKTATQCVVDQYSKYEAVPGVHLDGKLTAGENIADNGGVKLGFEAYKAWRSHQSTPPPHEVDGFSDDQLYFLAYGQSWCEKITPELLKTMAHTNPHSPAQWRVNGVIVNQPDFAPAFKCAANTPMNSGKQCSVW